MMESILQEKRISFKEFEKKIYQFVCGLGQEIARTMLENYDDHLAKPVTGGNIGIKGNGPQR